MKCANADVLPTLHMTLLAPFLCFGRALQDNVRYSNSPSIAGPVLQYRQRVRDLIAGIKVSYQGGAIGHCYHYQNVPAGNR